MRWGQRTLQASPTYVALPKFFDTTMGAVSLRALFAERGGPWSFKLQI